MKGRGFHSNLLLISLLHFLLWELCLLCGTIKNRTDDRNMLGLTDQHGIIIIKEENVRASFQDSLMSFFLNNKFDQNRWEDTFN